METGLTKQRIIAELTRSPHGKLDAYLPIMSQAVKGDAEFLAHLIAWNGQKGQVKDSKIALPVLSLTRGYPFLENSFAHMALLDPREFVRALFWANGLHKKNVIAYSGRRLAERYLRVRESVPAWWNATAVQHRASLRTLYGRYHVKPSAHADRVLFKGQFPAGSVFHAVANLSNMSGRDAAVAITKFKIPALVVTSALGGKKKDIDFLMALIDSMSGAELLNMTKMLVGLGMNDVPELRAAYEAGLKKVSEATKSVPTFKATRAAAEVSDAKVKAKLQAAQEKQIEKTAKVSGRWAVFGDKSGSMSASIESARIIAATLARTADSVHLIWFDSMPRPMDVTGLTYDEILEKTKNIRGDGGASIGCGLQWLLERKIEVDGIAIASDGGEGAHPFFSAVYPKYCKMIDRDIPVYFYLVPGSDPNYLTPRCNSEKIDVQLFDLRGGVDYYSLPGVIQTMRASRYSLLDEIMETPLLTLADVFKVEVKSEAAVA